MKTSPPPSFIMRSAFWVRNSTPDQWMAAAKDAGFREEVLPGIMKGNAMKVLGLGG